MLFFAKWMKWLKNPPEVRRAAVYFHKWDKFRQYDH